MSSLWLSERSNASAQNGLARQGLPERLFIMDSSFVSLLMLIFFLFLIYLYSTVMSKRSKVKVKGNKASLSNVKPGDTVKINYLRTDNWGGGDV